MTAEKLTQEAVEQLIGRAIVQAQENWIKLDDGCIIYLEDSEIKMLNT